MLWFIQEMKKMHYFYYFYFSFRYSEGTQKHNSLNIIYKIDFFNMEIVSDTICIYICFHLKKKRITALSLKSELFQVSTDV